MNGLILVKTAHPIENLLSTFIPAVQIGFIVDDQVYMIDNYDFYNFPIHRGLFLEVFKQNILLQSMAIKPLKYPDVQAFRVEVLEIMNRYKKPTVEQLIGWIFKLEKIQNNMDMIDYVCGKLKTSMDLGFDDWVPIPLPMRDQKHLKLKFKEIMTVLEPKLKQAANIFISLTIKHGMPDFHFNTEHKILCSKIFVELDRAIESSTLDLEAIERLKQEYLRLG